MNDVGVLLIHGFAGNAEEMNPLQEYLKQRGYRVITPLLPGHGRTKRDLSKVTRYDWISAVESAYLNLSRNCRRVFVVGFSMGGLLAVNLWHYGLTGLITVNMPVYYWNPAIIGQNLIGDFRYYGKKYLRASTDKPVSSVIEFLKLLTETKPLLENVTCRTMVIQAVNDDTVHYKSAYYILKRIPAEVLFQKPPCGGHMVFQSGQGEDICRMIENFIRNAAGE